MEDGSDGNRISSATCVGSEGDTGAGWAERCLGTKTDKGGQDNAVLLVPLLSLTGPSVAVDVLGAELRVRQYLHVEVLVRGLHAESDVDRRHRRLLQTVVKTGSEEIGVPVTIVTANKEGVPSNNLSF